MFKMSWCLSSWNASIEYAFLLLLNIWLLECFCSSFPSKRKMFKCKCYWYLFFSCFSIGFAKSDLCIVCFHYLIIIFLEQACECLCYLIFSTSSSLIGFSSTLILSSFCSTESWWLLCFWKVNYCDLFVVTQHFLYPV